MGDITQNFSFDEFKNSDSYPELAKSISLSDKDKTKIFYLTKVFLQPLRSILGPVKILSGKRSEELNEKIKGAKRSDHLYHGHSCAADFMMIETPTLIKQAFHYIRTMDEFFGQLILYPDRYFIHLSLPTERHYREILIKKKDSNYIPYEEAADLLGEY